MCCLGFRGDTSSGPIVDDYFNTTNEFLAMMSSTKYDFIWKKDARLPKYNRTIYIAFNLQYSNYQGSLTERWLGDMINIIQARNLDIQIVKVCFKINNTRLLEVETAYKITIE